MKLYILLFVFSFSFSIISNEQELHAYCKEWIWNGGACETTCNIAGTEIYCKCRPWPYKGCKCNGQEFKTFGGPNC
jgi:hypothetical protein